MRVVVLGSSGYTAETLLHLLINHPNVDEIVPVSTSLFGKKIEKFYKFTFNKKFSFTNCEFVSIEKAKTIKADVIFSCLPHLISAKSCAPFFGKSVVIDLSADFRIDNNNFFKKGYSENIPRDDLVKKAVYGLCEFNSEKIKRSNIIAVPGCYPTATLLPILPFAKSKLIKKDIVVNALSGVSGAGRNLKSDFLFCSRIENSNVYSPGKSHRHVPEMEYQLLKIANYKSDIIFNPHIIPQKQGLLVTTVANFKKKLSTDDAFNVLLDCYKNTPFVKIYKNIPQTKDVIFTNRCDISLHVEGSKLILFSAIDNLFKGASSAAIQNMNIRFGFKQNIGLDR